MYRLHLGKGETGARNQSVQLNPRDAANISAMPSMKWDLTWKRIGKVEWHPLFMKATEVQQPPQTCAVPDKVTGETRVGNGMPKLCFLGAESRETLSPALPFLSLQITFSWDI